MHRLEERAAEEKKREEEAKQNGDPAEHAEGKEGEGDGAEDGDGTPPKAKDKQGGDEEDTPAPEPTEDEHGSDSEHDELESSPEAEDRDGSVVSNADGASDSDSVGPARRNLGSRQQALREKTLQRKAEEAARQAEFVRQRELQRAKNAEQKRILAEKHRWEAEEERIAAREEAIDLEFRRYLLAPRLRPMGKDRFHDRYWWFDGIGNQTLTSANGAVQYGTGRLFVQGASEEDWKAACAGRKEKAVLKRREIEHGGFILQPDEWAMYDQPEDVSIQRLRRRCQNFPGTSLTSICHLLPLTYPIADRADDLLAAQQGQPRVRFQAPTPHIPQLHWSGHEEAPERPARWLEGV